MRQGDGKKDETGRWMPPRFGWLVAAVALAVAGGVLVGGPGGTPDVSGLDREERWTVFSDLDRAELVAPAADGSVWVGTGHGEVVHWDADGNDYTRYSLGQDLLDSEIVELTVGDSGTVWAVVAGSPPNTWVVARFDGRQWTTHTGAAALPSGRVESLALDDDTVWIAIGSADGGGVARSDGQEWTTYTPGDELPRGAVGSLAIDDAGTVWTALQPDPTGQGGGVARFDGQGWTPYTVADGLPAAEVSTVAAGGDGTVWAHVPRQAGWRGGVARFDGDEWTGWDTDGDLPGDSIPAMAAGNDGRAWVVSRSEPEGGETISGPADTVLWFDGDSWVTAVAAHEWPYGNFGRSLVMADDGTAWLITTDRPGTPGGAVMAVDPDGWRAYTRDHGLPHPRVASLTAGDGATVWAATARGAARFDGHQWTNYTTGVGPPGDRPTAVAMSDDDTMWSAGPAGVARFDGQQWQRWTSEDGLPADTVSALTLEGETVWAATADGLARFDGDQWTDWPGNDELAGQTVTSLTATDDTVWAATRRDVFRLDADQSTAVATDGLADTPVFALAADDDHVWAGTGNGVARFNGQQWVDVATDGNPLRLDADHPAATQPISAVTIDDTGTVWATTPEGLARFDRLQWTTTRDDHFVADASSLAVSDDALWVTTQSGLATFTYDQD